MMSKSPVYHIRAVPIEKIIPNDYNPNAVAPPEMKLLYDSIKADGYTTVSYTHLDVYKRQPYALIHLITIKF